MSNPERPNESFESMARSQRVWESLGIYFFPIPKEHTEGLITRPLLSRIKSKIRQRGFERLAAHTAITFSGYADDPREIHQVPEVRAFWRKLDRELEELPALLTVMPEANYNGPVQHLSLLGEIDRIVDHPAQRRHDVHILNADTLIKDAVARIMRSGMKYQLHPDHIAHLVHFFIVNTEFPQPKDGMPDV